MSPSCPMAAAPCPPATTGPCRVWDLETGDNRRLDGHSNGIDSLAVSADGKRVLSGSFDGVVVCWDLEKDRELTFCSAHAGTATSVSFAPGGRFVTACDREPEIRVWQLPEPGASPPSAGLQVPLEKPLPQAPGEVVRFAGHRDGLACVAVSADGRWVLTGSGFRSADGQLLTSLENEVRLWDAESGKEVRRFRGHTGSVFRVLFSRRQASLVGRRGRDGAALGRGHGKGGPRLRRPRRRSTCPGLVGRRQAPGDRHGERDRARVRGRHGEAAADVSGGGTGVEPGVFA